ncbi:hypothetical protein vseg_013419 [Gypsophila vaccaria]
MAPSARVKAAFKAMKAIGISEAKTKPALKKLLQVFDKNWAVIEEESYRVLADYIFEYEETETAEKEKKKKPENDQRGRASEAAGWQDGPWQDEPMQEEPERPLKRLRLRHQGPGTPPGGQPTPTSSTGPLKIPKPEPGVPDSSPSQNAQCRNTRPGSQHVSPQPLVRNKGKQPVSGDSTGRVQPSAGTPVRNKRAESGTSPYAKQKQSQMIALIKPKDEPFTNDVVSIEPLAVVLPENTNNKAVSEPANQVSCQDGQRSETVNGVGRDVGSMVSTEEEKQLQEVGASDRTPTRLNIAASSLGKVQVSLTCNPESEGYEVNGPDLEAIMKKVNDECLKTYKITDPDFSITKLMTKFCDCIEEHSKIVHGALEGFSRQDAHTNVHSGICITPHDSSLNGESFQDGADTTDGTPEDNSNQNVSEDNCAKIDITEMSKSIVVPLDSSLNGESFQDGTDITDGTPEDNSTQNVSEDNCAKKDITEMSKSIVVPLDSSLNGESFQDGADTTDGTQEDNSTQNVSEDNCAKKDDITEMSKSIVVAHPCDTSDITMGKETVIVSLEKFNCEFLPTFCYITQNVISDNADLKHSLAQIGDQDCCLSCHADCLSLSSCCNCSQRNGGELPYTADGLLKEEFLDECVSIVRNPQKDDLMYCKECPLEKLKNEDMLDPCKGHLKRKYIKECYTKCGCSQYCGNRVVQSGLRYNLQVFWTPEGKGLGLRASDNLLKGAFVCEFVGEILTTTELHKRNLSRSNDKHSYSLLLDSDWGTSALKKDGFLCLDATYYGNVGRFINHRCTDANLIEIPVEVESPSHHYYHVALFTTRNVDAFEELTWDYGVDFDDNELHIKSFRCLCGSRFCRNMKRSSRSRSALTLQ